MAVSSDLGRDRWWRLVIGSGGGATVHEANLRLPEAVQQPLREGGVEEQAEGAEPRPRWVPLLRSPCALEVMN